MRSSDVLFRMGTKSQSYKYERKGMHVYALALLCRMFLGALAELLGA